MIIMGINSLYLAAKVFSVDKRNTNTLTVDIEYHEAAKYKIVE